MNANAIVNDQMTLEEKLAAIDKAMRLAQEQSNEERTRAGLPPVMIDPALATVCDGCE